MEDILVHHIRIPQAEDARPKLPQLRLKLSASHRLSLTLPFTIHFTIEHQDRPLTSKALIFEWSSDTHGFAQSGFVLLRHTTPGLEEIPIDHSGRVDNSRHGCMLVNGWNQGLWELGSGKTVTFQTSLPARYQKVLRANETYTLLWPGGEVALWEHGTLHEHIGRELDDNATPLTLPGGPHVIFSTYAEAQPWPDRAEREARIGFDRANLAEQMWRLEQSRVPTAFPPAYNKERDPDAPCLRVSLDCASTIQPQGHIEVRVKVTYEADEHARPVTFRTRVFENYDNYQLGRLRHGAWEKYDYESTVCGGFLLVEDPDVRVTVGQSEYFASLRPGESWLTSQRVGCDGAEIPDDAEDGESFRYAFTGATVNWWDWGTKADHAETVVKLPCWLTGPVVDPEDNNGRPRLVVSSSNVVEISLVR